MNPTNATATDIRIMVLSGPSGSGKTTIVNRLLAEAPVPMLMAVSATTRPMRTGEVEGKDYYFLNDADFRARRDAGEFLECAEVHRSGCWYGTLRSELDRIRKEGAWSLLEVDVEGALNVMQVYPDAVTVFLRTPSPGEYEKRLRARGTEDEETIRLRLNTAREELKFADRYRFEVINDNLQDSVREICEIIASREAQLHAE